MWSFFVKFNFCKVIEGISEFYFIRFKIISNSSIPLITRSVKVISRFIFHCLFSHRLEIFPRIVLKAWICLADEVLFIVGVHSFFVSPNFSVRKQVKVCLLVVKVLSIDICDRQFFDFLLFGSWRFLYWGGFGNWFIKCKGP